MADAVAWLADEGVAVATKADFLTALARKGETAEEIAGFARALRARAVAVPLDAELRAGEVLDVVGTGGDRLGTFNISTAAAFVAAAAGIAVAKHGNRAVTSRTGSADVLEALGVRIDLTPAQAARSLREHGFAFFFAPAYHPAFKHIVPARKLCAERGQPTLFNVLGPLLNPARPTAQLIGVPRPPLCERMARVLQSLGVRRGMVVSGEVHGPEPGGGLRLEGGAANPGGSAVRRWMDELSTAGETTAAEYHSPEGVNLFTVSPGQFRVAPTRVDDLLGGDPQWNAELIRRVLGGEERGPRRDVVLLNAAAALWVGGRAGSLAEGWELAGSLIDSGRVSAKLEAVIAGGG